MKLRTSVATRERRRSSDERREQVLAAAVAEFAEFGYRGGRTVGIAARAGISQPYLYALFPNKKELFLAAHRRVVERIGAAFVAGLAGGGGLAGLGSTYTGLLENREELLCLLQAYAAAGDPDIQTEVREAFVGLFDRLGEESGASDEDLRRFFAMGMLLSVASALDLPERICSPRSALPDLESSRPATQRGRPRATPSREERP